MRCFRIKFSVRRHETDTFRKHMPIRKNIGKKITSDTSLLYRFSVAPRAAPLRARRRVLNLHNYTLKSRENKRLCFLLLSSPNSKYDIRVSKRFLTL